MISIFLNTPTETILERFHDMKKISDIEEYMYIINKSKVIVMFIERII
jgi:hypothetical protein